MAVRGIDYCLHEWGDEDAPAVFFLHGWADTGATFQFVVDALESRWHVIAPDWRGFGRSSHAAAAYWFPDYLADLDVILRHYSPDAPVRLVGHSMGGNIASLYGGALPERVRAIVNIEGFGLADSDPADAPARFRDWLTAQNDPPRFSYYPNFAPLVRRICMNSPRLSSERAEFVARQWAVEEDAGVHLRADPKHKMPNAILYRRAEAEACWRNIAADLLMVSGGKSTYTDFFADLDLSAYPDCESVVIEDAGHMVHFEAPEALAQQIECFLKKTL